MPFEIFLGKLKVKEVKCGGRVARWCWVNFQCWLVLLIWIFKSRARAYCACSRCRWWLFGHFLSSIVSLFFLPCSGLVGWLFWA